MRNTGVPSTGLEPPREWVNCGAGRQPTMVTLYYLGQAISDPGGAPVITSRSTDRQIRFRHRSSFVISSEVISCDCSARDEGMEYVRLLLNIYLGSGSVLR